MPEWPSGTVTFLFTDIEGSTPLWERDPESMQTALSTHNDLIRQAIHHFGGLVYKIIGDSFSAAFSNPAKALCAAVEAQRNLANADWGAIGALRVRMGIHTGPAEALVSEEPGVIYSGHTLNRAARIMSAGHGGQILLSQESADLVRRDLPAGVSLRDLGEHKLKGLSYLERIYQAVIADLPSDFPPLASESAVQHNLPVALTSFIGRENDIHEVTSLLDDPATRLITLVGPGGAGKTRLALQVAWACLARFPDGVFFIDLAPIDRADLVAETTSRSLGLRETSGPPMLDILKNYLHQRHLLLLLDNFEQVIDAAPLVNELLASAPELKIMVTSRETLRLSAEQVYPVPPLDLPPIEPGQPLAMLARYESIQLFVQRARAIQPGFDMDAINAPLITQICVRLDGLPLAIELAASWTRTLTCQEIAAEIEHGISFLAALTRDLPERQRSMRAVFEYSWRLLAEDERRVLNRLSVFRGGFTRQAAEQVAGATLSILSALIDKSLLQIDPRAVESRRYDFHELVRQYAEELLEEAVEAGQTRDRHLDFFLKLAGEAENRLHGPDQLAWLDRLEMELDNLRAALRWSQGDEVEGERGLRLAEALFWFWYIHNYMREGRAWFEGMFGREKAMGRTLVRARVLYGAGALAVKMMDVQTAKAQLDESITIFREAAPAGRPGLAYALVPRGELLHYYEGRSGDAASLFQESLGIFRELGDRWGQALALQWLGVVAALDEPAASRAHFEESLALFRELGDRWALTMPLGGMANLMLSQGNHAAARALLEENLSIQQEFRDKFGVAYSLGLLGNSAMDREEYEQAAGYYREALAIRRAAAGSFSLGILLEKLNYIAQLRGDYEEALSFTTEMLSIDRDRKDPWGLAVALREQAIVSYHLGDYDRAGRLFKESLPLFHEVGNMYGLAACLAGLAGWATTRPPPDPLRAAILLGATQALLDAKGIALRQSHRAEYEQCLAHLHATLDETALNAAWAEGQSMTIDQIILYALETIA